RKRPSRKPFPEHLPRERVIVPGPIACPCCGGARLSKLGEDVTETLEVIPRQWKVIQHVREKFSCRDCEAITQAPAPFHVIPRGWAGPSLLAMILFEKFGQHQPLNRQAERYAREGVPLSLSTLADPVGAGCGLVGSPRAGGSPACPLSPPAPGARPKAGRPRSSRPSPWKRFSASTPCSTSSAPSTGLAPISAKPRARNTAPRSSPVSRPGCAKN